MASSAAVAAPAQTLPGAAGIVTRPPRHPVTAAALRSTAKKAHHRRQKHARKVQPLQLAEVPPQASSKAQDGPVSAITIDSLMRQTADLTRKVRDRAESSSVEMLQKVETFLHRADGGTCVLTGAAGAAAVWFGLLWYHGKEPRRGEVKAEDDTPGIPQTMAEVEGQRTKLLRQLEQLKEEEKNMGKSLEGEDGPAEAAQAMAQSLTASLEDYDKMLQDVLQKAADVLAPKIVKGQALRSLAEGRVSSFSTKAQAFLVSELNEAAAEVCEVLDVPEAMLLMDRQDGVDRVPTISVLLAGVLSPFIMQSMFWLHLVQVLVVLLPYAVLVTWALKTDYGSACPAIPTLNLWILVQALMVYLLIGSRCWLIFNISKAQRSLQKRLSEMRETLALKGNTARGLEGVKDVLQGHLSVLQQGLLAEEQIQQCPARHMVGACASVWLLASVWTFVLVIGWGIVPGEVQYSYRGIVRPENYCGSWATVLTARVSALVAGVVCVANAGAVIHWLMDVAFSDDSLAGSIMHHAKEFDESNVGLPVAQLLARTFFLRDTKDMAFTRLAVAKDQKARLAKDITAAQKTLEAMKAQLVETESRLESLQQAADNHGDPEACRTVGNHLPKFEEAEEWISSLRSKGLEAIESTRAQAATLELRTDQFETMLLRINEGAEQLRNSETYQSALQAARSAGKQTSAFAYEIGDRINAVQAQAQASDGKPLSEVFSAVREAAMTRSSQADEAQAKQAEEEHEEDHGTENQSTAPEEATEAPSSAASAPQGVEFHRPRRKPKPDN
eukprot:gb/GFBE01002220.1/.p1 GENE.gb/GFBE01002220.1/~~gb/GFBE01002220.1/.p1  ORF type:complete len:785 (+),score=193.66 gb/GFBE01002220.1/:1-2355(+)